VVLFVGVLYHMRHPLLALERLASVTDQLAIVDTHVGMVDYEKPAMIFYPDAELNDDSTNWWGPNPAAVEAMLATVGFTRFERKHPESIKDGRFTVHAWR
jgi:tRNA (mo5U34)-methyltransferase